MKWYEVLAIVLILTCLAGIGAANAWYAPKEDSGDPPIVTSIVCVEGYKFIVFRGRGLLKREMDVEQVFVQYGMAKHASPVKCDG